MNSYSERCSRSLIEQADVFASAPGRIEFLGNHTDYNGGRVLGATIDKRVDVGLTRRDDRWIILESEEDLASVRVPLDEAEFRENEGTWANYVLGVLTVLQAKGLTVPTGFELHVESTLPVGAGLSSSAALELATAFALIEAFEGSFSRKELARLCRRAENNFVGVPCGLLDQAVVAFGSEDHLVHLDALTEEITSVPFPARTTFWIFRTHQSHTLSEAHYQERHDEARAVRDRLDDLVGNVEHLVDVTPDQLETVRDKLPDTFYRRARHVVTEHRRVKSAVRLLCEGNYDAVGKLLFASHESSRTNYENSTEALDLVVNQLAGIDAVIGARLTGAGFGGAVVAWTRPSFSADEAEMIAAAYADVFNTELEQMTCHPAPAVFVRGSENEALSSGRRSSRCPASDVLLMRRST